MQFRDKHYREEQPHTMTLTAGECIRRVLLHVLPAGFHRIRYFGLLGNRHRKDRLARCRQFLGTSAPETAALPTDYRDRYEALTGRSLRACPVCHDGHMLVIEHVARAPWRPAITDTS